MEIDVVERLLDVGILGGEEVGGVALHDADELYADVVAFVRGVALHLLYHLRRVITGALHIHLHARQRGVSQLTSNLVVVDAKHREVLRNLDVEHVALLHNLHRHVVIGSEERCRLGQTEQPLGERLTVVVPHLVEFLRTVGAQLPSEAVLAEGRAEAAQPLVAPHHVVIAVERERPEALVHVELSGLAPGGVVVTRDVGNILEPLLIVLRDGDDAVAMEQREVVVGLKLSDDSVGLPRLRPFGHAPDALDAFELGRHLADDPRRCLLRVFEDAAQQLRGILLGEVGE